MEQRIWFRDGRRVRASEATRRLVPSFEFDRRVRNALDAENVWPNPNFRAEMIVRRGVDR